MNFTVELQKDVNEFSLDEALIHDLADVELALIGGGDVSVVTV
jgi:hypothetical protein